MYAWSNRSHEKLITCEKDIQRLFNEVLKYTDCTVVCGHRNEQKQNEYYYSTPQRSKLKYPNSKHNKYPSQAIDIVPFINGELSWVRDDIIRFAGIVLIIARQLYDAGEMSHKIRWGGTWSTKFDAPFARFFDGAHFELQK